MNSITIILQLVARIIVFTIAFPVHEFAHAFVANKLGDPTAKNMGRLDLNPFAHMRVLPAIAMLLLATVSDILTNNGNIGNMLLFLTSVFFFTAVPINPFYFKNRKAGIALTALAGPVSNIIIATIVLIIYKIIYYFIPTNQFLVLVITLLSLLIQINLQLAVFNLIPIPPLDGFKVISFFLKDNILWKIEQYSNYILMGLFVVIYFTNVLDKIIFWGYGILFKFIDSITFFVDFIGRMVK